MKKSVNSIDSIKKRIVGSRNQIAFGNSMLAQVLFDIEGNDNHILIENGCLLNGVTFFIRGNGHKIKIGSNCRFNRGGNLWFEDYNGLLDVGSGTTFENVHIAVTEPNSRVLIGNDCMLAYDIDIRTGDSHSIVNSESGTRINYAKNVHIGNHVWIAAHCIILKGVSIADNCVVASGSVVVNGANEKGVVIAGNPAMTVKRGITWLRDRTYKPENQ